MARPARSSLIAHTGLTARCHAVRVPTTSGLEAARERGGRRDDGARSTSRELEREPGEMVSRSRITSGVGTFWARAPFSALTPVGGQKETPRFS